MTDQSIKIFLKTVAELWAAAQQAATAEADAKYLPVIEKLVEALEFAKINLNDFRGCIYDRDDDDIKTQEKIAEALALSEPLLGKREGV